jgi:AcrR family transcriptional regulator
VPDDSEPRRAGRPRDQSLDAAVLAAAADLLVERGYRGVTMEALARRAATTKSAIYRRWPSRTAVLLDVLARRLPAPEVPAIGDSTTDVFRAARQLAEALTDPVVAQGATGLLADATADPQIGAQFRRQLVEPQIIAAESAVAAAREAGLCPPWLTGALLADVVTGTVLQHVVVRGEPADDRFLGELAQLLGRALG